MQLVRGRFWPLAILAAAALVAALVFFSANTVGWAALLAIVLIVLLVAQAHPAVALPAYVGLGLRVGLLLIGTYIVALPDSQSDALRFERHGWEIAQSRAGDLQTYLSGHARAYEFLIAVFYSAFGRCPMVLLARNVLLGTLSIFETHRVALMLWGPTSARRAARAIAILPTPVLYSAL